jgi:hypothetical protein
MSTEPNVARALADEREREQAATCDAALVAYQDKWARKLARLQRAHPQRWRVPGLSEEEVRDALTLRLIEAVRTPAEARPASRAGKEWGLTVAEQHLRTLRRTFRLAATPVDFDGAPLAGRAPTQEELCLEHEAAAHRALAGQRAAGDLNHSQRRWLAALELAAAQGEFFAASDQLNLSAASRLLNKNRSSAHRAYRELQERFARALAPFTNDRGS